MSQKDNRYDLVFNGRDVGTSYQPETMVFSPDGTKIAIEKNTPDGKYVVSVISKDLQDTEYSESGLVLPLECAADCVAAATRTR